MSAFLRQAGSNNTVKVLIAPNALKGSLSAVEAALALEKGIRQAVADAELVSLPVADGGDGLLQVLRDALQAESRRCRVSGPLGQVVEASYLYAARRKTAVIEMASAAGLALLSPGQLSPLDASTTGVGQLILAALDAGAEQIILGLGGSATNDAGTGMVQALGVRFFDKQGETVSPSGGTLADIETIDTGGLDSRIGSTRFQLVCDVDNPLLGERGAAQVFAPQKGASPRQVKRLEAGLAQFADQLQQPLVDLLDHSRFSFPLLFLAFQRRGVSFRQTQLAGFQ